jgi:hypothetical protein
MFEQSSFVDLSSSMKELHETQATNWRLRAELRQVLAAARAGCGTTRSDADSESKSIKPFGWWVCEEPEE